jgi:site-specific DNA-methyltransferase (adenine-specific)
MNKADRQVLFSSLSDEYETPGWVFDPLNKIFKFTLDPAASHLSHMCHKYYTIDDDGPSKSWKNEVVFINPPYSKKSKPVRWLERVYTDKVVAAVLLPARTETRLWHDWVWPMASHLFFFRGRIKFNNRLNWVNKPTSAPFPSALAFYRTHNYDLGSLLNWPGALFRNPLCTYS